MKERSVKGEIKATTQQIEQDYGMSYDEMYECYLKNDEPLRHHIGVSYVEGMKRALKLMEIEMEEEYQREKNKDYALDNMTNDLTYNEETGEWVSNE